MYSCKYDTSSCGFFNQILQEKKNEAIRKIIFYDSILNYIVRFEFMCVLKVTIQSSVTYVAVFSVIRFWLCCRIDWVYPLRIADLNYVFYPQDAKELFITVDVNFTG